jgi:hypothetical protein
MKDSNINRTADQHETSLFAATLQLLHTAYCIPHTWNPNDSQWFLTDLESFHGS